ncbi:hypothetical protein [Embleya sp. AB8]|uniref:hypothetical protein n=1 Tax=Embleya sp. AB8 TaxID=3156304 RepID=UPI003C75499E
MRQTLDLNELAFAEDEFDLAALDLSGLTVVGMQDSAEPVEGISEMWSCSCCCYPNIP